MNESETRAEHIDPARNVAAVAFLPRRPLRGGFLMPPLLGVELHSIDSLHN